MNQEEAIIISGGRTYSSYGWNYKHALIVGDGQFIACFSGFEKRGVNYDRLDSYDQADNPITIESGQWYHVVGTCFGLTDPDDPVQPNPHERLICLYVNGVLVDSMQPTANSYHFNEVDWESGTANDTAYWNGSTNPFGSADPFKGEIDQINIYDLELSAAEVQANCNAGPIVPEPASISLMLLGLGLVAKRRRK